MTLPVDTFKNAPLHERVAALSRALTVVPEPEREHIALSLFEIAAAAKAPARDRPAGPLELLAELPRKGRIRHAETAMDAIVSGWDCVPASVRPLIGGLDRQRWIATAARVAASSEAGHRINAARFAHDTADPGMARVVSPLLPDADAGVRLQADRALLRLVMTLLTHVPAEQLGAEFASVAARPRIPLPAEPGVIELERVELCRCVADAAWSFADHRCRSPLIGSLLLLDRLPGGILERTVAERIRRLLKEKHHPSHAPIRSVLRGTPSPLLRERALRWIVLDAVAPVCVDRLSSADSDQEHEIVLSRAHLALRRSRGTRLRKLRAGTRDASGAIPTPEVLAGLSPEARRGAVRMIPLVGLEDTDRRIALEPTLADADPVARLLGAHAAHPADLTDYTFDTSPAVARSAATRWATLGVTPPRVGAVLWDKRTEHASILARSPHAEVRRLARTELDRLDPFAGTPASRVAARRLLEREPITFVRLVRERIHADATVMPALELIRAIDLGDRFEMDLIDLATTHADDRVRATAVALLGRSMTEEAGRVVRAALDALDPRVRSNAIESVSPDPDVLLEYKNDTSHRVRASAVRRVLSFEGVPTKAGMDAGEALASLLTDDRDAHRLSGAWAAERVLRADRRDTLGPVYRHAVRSVIEAANRDRDDRVRRRAARCVRLLGLQDPAALGAA